MSERLDAWAQASDLVSDALDGGVTFEWPGHIVVQVTPTVFLHYGDVNETINANIEVLDADGMMQPIEDLPDSLITDVPSDTTDAQAIAAAIVASVKQWS